MVERVSKKDRKEKTEHLIKILCQNLNIELVYYSERGFHTMIIDIVDIVEAEDVEDSNVVVKTV